MKARIQGRGPEESLLGGWQSRTVSEWLDEACKEAQVLDGFTFHCLRHTFAAHMLSKGVPIYKVSKILGHSTVLVTEQHYGHLDKRVLADEIHHIDSIMTVPRIVDPSGLRGGRQQVVNGARGKQLKRESPTVELGNRNQDGGHRTVLKICARKGTEGSNPSPSAHELKIGGPSLFF